MFPDARGHRHGVLPGVSTGCPPDEGWLHTRYAPVRHSRGPEGPLPFDLHVLGLPLAFILSQDQTLHCIIVVLVVFLLGLRYDFILLFLTKRVRASRRPPLDSCFLCWPQAFKELFASGVPLVLTPHFSGRKRVQKYNLFSYVVHQNATFFQKIFVSVLNR